MRVSRGPLLLCVGGCWLWFRGAGVSEGGGWPAARRWHAQPRQPRDCGPTSSFWWPGPAEGGGWSRNGRLAGCQPRAPVPTSPFWVGPPGVGTLSPANHVIVDRSPVSGGQGPQKVGVGPEGGGWPGGSVPTLRGPHQSTGRRPDAQCLPGRGQDQSTRPKSEHWNARPTLDS